MLSRQNGPQSLSKSEIRHPFWLARNLRKDICAISITVPRKALFRRTGPQWPKTAMENTGFFRVFLIQTAFREYRGRKPGIWENIKFNLMIQIIECLKDLLKCYPQCKFFERFTSAQSRLRKLWTCLYLFVTQSNHKITATVQSLDYLSHIINSSVQKTHAIHACKPTLLKCLRCEFFVDILRIYTMFSKICWSPIHLRAFRASAASKWNPVIIFFTVD